MNNPLSAAAINARGSTQYPRRLTLSLVLEVDAPDAEAEAYLVDAEGKLQLGLLADLLDVLNLDMELGVQSINGVSAEEVRRQFQKLL